VRRGEGWRGLPGVVVARVIPGEGAGGGGDGGGRGEVAREREEPPRGRR
jgi:hypothetical protein